MRKIIELNSYACQLSHCLTELKGRRPNLDEQYIIIVPDHVSLTAEQKLCDILGGAFDVTISSFNRLFAGYVTDTRQYLPRQGSVMLLRKILLENKSRLVCYKKSYDKKNFAQSLYNIISFMKSENITAEDISSLPLKGQDLQLIYDEYSSAIAGKLTDSGGRLELLSSVISDTSIFTNAHIILACFDKFTHSQKEIISQFEANALSVTEYQLKGRVTLADVEVYSAQSRVEIAKAITRRIVELLASGESIDDICVCSSDGKADEVKRIFNENSIPYFITEPEKLSTHPLGRFLSLALTPHGRVCDYANLAQLSKSMYSGVSKIESDCFERYVCEYGIGYRDIDEPLTLYGSDKGHNKEIYNSAENARKKLADIMQSGEPFASKVTRLFDMARANGGDNGDDMRADPIEKANSLAQLAMQVMPRASDNQLCQALVESFELCDLASSTAMRGGIYIDKVSAFRAREFKYIFITDFDYDNFPTVHQDTNLLTDADVLALRISGQTDALTARELCFYEEQELLRFLSSAKNIFIGYTQKLGSYFETLKRHYIKGCIKESTYASERDDLFFGDLETVRKYCPTNAMLANYARQLVGLNTGEVTMPAHTDAVLSGARNLISRYVLECDRLQKGDVPITNSSASRLQTYAECPRKFFNNYVICARKTREGKINAMERGTLLHSIAEDYVNQGMPDPEKSHKIFIQNCIKAYEEERGIKLSKIDAIWIYKAGHSFINNIHTHIQAGGYKPEGCELKFTVENAFNIDGQGLSLTGSIDRYDVCDDIVRIIDYKSKKKTLVANDVYVGMNLQPLLYLGYFLEQGKRLGGAYYFSTDQQWDAKFTDVNGVINTSDWSVDIESVTHDSIGNAKLTSMLKVNDDGMHTLINYAYRCGENLLSELYDGYVQPSPIGDACTYCDYSATCRSKHLKRKKQTVDVTELKDKKAKGKNK